MVPKCSELVSGCFRRSGVCGKAMRNVGKVTVKYNILISMHSMEK